jgi:4-aminobutyrate aminotransferase/(S)-3-amino-2-methylpropionate transaminase
MRAENVSLRTAVPGPRSRDWIARRNEFVPRGVGNTNPVFAVRAEGALIEDVDGNVFIDFAGGIGVMNVGHGQAEVVAAIQEQAAKLIHACFHVAMYEPYVRLAEKLAKLAPGDFAKKTLLVNSGAEAVENAIKIARHYTGRPGVIVLENAFHGRTLLGMSLTAKVNPYKLGFGPMAPEIHRAPSAYCYRCAFGKRFPDCHLACVAHIDRILGTDLDPKQIAAVILEPVQGEGGFIVPPPGYLEALQALCRKHGILLIADEIQTGFGRTGKMLACEHWGLEPDLITLAKSMGGGLPIAAVTGRAEIMDAVHPGGLGGTYGGNPVAAAAALKVIEVMEREDYPQKAREIGGVVERRFRSWMEQYECVGDVRALGAMVALELVADQQSKEPAAGLTARVMQDCYEHGLLLIKAGTYNNVIRFLAPLTITPAQLETGLSILEAAIARQSNT